MGMIAECLLLLSISLGYQRISRHWMWLQLIGLATTLVAFIFQVLVIPESPKFLYMQKRYTESKETLRYIAWFNGSSLAKDTTFLFDSEYKMLLKKKDLPRIKRQ